MDTKRFLIVAIAVFCTGVSPQVAAQYDNISASNRLNLWISDSGSAGEYLNHFDIQYLDDNWLIGARLELDEESRLDPERLTEVTRRFAQYSENGMSLLCGNQYLTLGRGLLLRAMEDNDVQLDRDIDGVSGAIAWQGVEGRAFFGRPRNDDTRLRDDLLFGADVDIELGRALTVGAGYVRTDEDDDDSGSNQGRPREELFGGRLSFTAGSIDFYFESATRLRHGELGPRGDWEVSTRDNGSASYGALSVSLDGCAFMLEGKDYTRFDVPYSTPPTCDSDGKSLNQGFDERGLSLISTISPTRNLVVSSAFSAAEAREADEKRVALGAKARLDWPSRGALMLGGDWADEEGLRGHSGRTYWGPTFEAAYHVSSRLALECKGHCLVRSDSLPGYTDDYLELQTAMTISFVGYGSATYSTTVTTEPVREFDNQDTWMSLQLNCNLSYKYDMSLIFGKERGGIACSGGICHYVSPFSGIRFEMIMRL